MRLSRIRENCVHSYLRLGGPVWNHLPGGFRRGALGRAYGKHLHTLVSRLAERNQSHATFFLRNRAELELLRRLIAQREQGSHLNVSVLACSKGAEVYSMVHAIRSARPDLSLKLHALDISQEIVSFAERGSYSCMNPCGPSAAAHPGDATWRDQVWRDRFVSIFARMTEAEVQEMFESVGDQFRVRSWLKEGITWMQGDANDPRLAGILGPQDIVVANRFLCHMRPHIAEPCLQNVGRLIMPGGHLFVSGVDLDVKTRVARKMGWTPVTEMIKEMYEGDLSLIDGWPMCYWGVEPFSRAVPDWQMRYAAVFQIN
jgi:chemotaxis methyl-accepting protein methylase